MESAHQKDDVRILGCVLPRNLCSFCIECWPAGRIWRGYTDIFENVNVTWYGRCVNDVKTHTKLHDPDCYHIILYSRHNQLAKKHNEPLPRDW